MQLPEDVIRLIVDRVFDVGALDTSPGCTEPAARMATAFAVESLEGSARALCLVSRLFYGLCMRRSCEVIAVHDHRRLQPLAASLRAPRAFLEKPRGLYCRRLDIDIWVHSYSSWSHGAATLWGLTSACPRLEVLTISVLSTDIFSTTGRPGRDECLCPLSLLIQLADAYGPSLRRFELRGLVSVHFSGIHYLAARCPHLEILCVPRMFAMQEDYDSEMLDMEAELDPPQGIVVLPTERMHEAIPLMSHEERHIFSRTHADALARCRQAPSPVSLPCLHTLEVGDFIDYTRHWHLPRLRVLHAAFSESADPVTEVRRRAAQTSALERHAAQLTAWTVVESLREIDPWAQLARLPVLRYFAFPVERNCYDRPGEHLARHGHKQLERVDIVVHGSFHQPKPWPWLSFLHSLVVSGALPALREIRIVGHSHHLPSEWKDEFAAWKGSCAQVRVRLEFVAGFLWDYPKVFHVPALKDADVFSPRQYEATHRTIKTYSREYPDLVRRLCTGRRAKGPL